MNLTKSNYYIPSHQLTRVISILLVLIFTGPFFYALSSSILNNIKSTYEQSQVIELEDMNLEGEENREGQENEKEETESLKEFTLSDSFSLTLAAYDEAALYVLYLNHLQGIESKLRTPPPKLV
jgi:hypothetical protein